MSYFDIANEVNLLKKNNLLNVNKNNNFREEKLFLDATYSNICYLNNIVFLVKSCNLKEPISTLILCSLLKNFNLKSNIKNCNYLARLDNSSSTNECSSQGTLNNSPNEQTVNFSKNCEQFSTIKQEQTNERKFINCSKFKAFENFNTTGVKNSYKDEILLFNSFKKFNSVSNTTSNDVNSKHNSSSSIFNISKINNNNNNTKTLTDNISNSNSIFKHKVDLKLYIKKPECMRSKIKSFFCKYMYDIIKASLIQANKNELFYKLPSKLVTDNTIISNLRFLNMTVKEVFTIKTKNNAYNDKAKINENLLESKNISKNFETIINKQVKDIYNIYINSEIFEQDMRSCLIKYGNDYVHKLKIIANDLLDFYLS